MLRYSIFLLILGAYAGQVRFHAKSHTEDYKFNPLHHLPGISPYFDAVGSGLDHDAPRDCVVTAASYLIRHASIYANDADYEDYIAPFLRKLDNTKGKGWTGELAFLNKWTSPITDPETQLEEITPQGKRDAKEVGKHLLHRYAHLIPTTKHIYCDKKSRTRDTADALAAAFPNKVSVREIDTETSFHAQIPHKSCPAFSKSPGDAELAAFIGHYTPRVIARLAQFSPSPLTSSDIIGMQQMCGYESAITGHTSPLCAAFTDDEWMAYEYAFDMKYSYMCGHANPLSPYLGFPWLNTTAALFEKLHAPQHHDDEDVFGKKKKDQHTGPQRFFLSFTHREVPPFIATALGLFNSSNAQAEEFPTDRINWSRSWRMTELIPFLGHIGIEKLTCARHTPHTMDGETGPPGDAPTTEEYIRIIANSAPRPIPNCQNGPGASCSVDAFTALVAEGMKTYGDFHKVCGNSSKY
ncbi:histidine acid phosphatase-like protein [Protomyces lactucae-debilis]|uniref:Histidine acid phosphatase-like protein n=1 Tax=Protomyces lactucae-debilis TaxID=2754530 RepID=A0A1Y2FFB5_PROLT|nr:histidine acid phosphatase-like protein [Protomyces lactucae-debilis]ORY82638.1 histidine acid phosphatase-like protein [Protomyces lactucae-debilis]